MWSTPFVSLADKLPELIMRISAILAPESGHRGECSCAQVSVQRTDANLGHQATLLPEIGDSPNSWVITPHQDVPLFTNRTN